MKKIFALFSIFIGIFVVAAYVRRVFDIQNIDVAQVLGAFSRFQISTEAIIKFPHAVGVLVNLGEMLGDMFSFTWNTELSGVYGVLVNLSNLLFNCLMSVLYFMYSMAEGVLIAVEQCWANAVAIGDLCQAIFGIEFFDPDTVPSFPAFPRWEFTPYSLI